jgi:hypothetical protein
MATKRRGARKKRVTVQSEQQEPAKTNAMLELVKFATVS